MTVVSRKHVDDYIRKHADARDALLNWFKEAKSALWESPQDIKNRYPSASVLENNYVVFNIKGNHYRLTTQINYANSTVVIKRIETHAEYSKR